MIAPECDRCRSSARQGAKGRYGSGGEHGQAFGGLDAGILLHVEQRDRGFLRYVGLRRSNRNAGRMPR